MLPWGPRNGVLVPSTQRSRHGGVQVKSSSKDVCLGNTSPENVHPGSAAGSSPGSEQKVSRRTVLKWAGAGALTLAAAPYVFVPRVSAQRQQTLRIIQWSHF